MGDSIILNENFFSQISTEIMNRNYENAIDLCIKAINDNIYNTEKDKIYAILEKVVLISDKSKYIAESIVKNLIISIIYHSDLIIKMNALIILERISRFQPSLVLNFQEHLEINLNDDENTIRELSYKILGTLIINNIGQKEELISLLLKSLTDRNWKIRLLGLNFCTKIITTELNNISKEMKNTLIEKISVMIFDNDEEIQTTALESLVKIYPYIDSKIMIYIIFRLIGHPNFQIREKGVWLISELAIIDYSEIIEETIPKFNVLIKDGDISVQTKIIDSLVKIGKKYPSKIVDFIFNNLKNLKDKKEEKDIYNIYFDVLMYLGLEIPDEIISIILKEISIEIDNSSIFCEFLSNLLIKLNNEIPDVIEQHIALEFSNFDNSNWQIRLKSVKFIGVINAILKSKNIAIWSDLKLNELLREENDPDVINAINYSLTQIHSSIDNLSILSKEINQELNLLYQRMVELQKQPLILKDILKDIIKKNEFREASITIEEKINEIIKNVENFGKQIYNYKYRRLALDLLEDWADLRLEILEELSNLKNELNDQIEICRNNYIEQLKSKIEQIRTRIDVLKSELEFLVELNNEIKQLIIEGNISKSKKKLEHLSYIRDKIYRLESEIGSLWIENLDFKELLQDITYYWVQVKIEAQQLLYTISYNLKDLHQYIEKIEQEDKKELKIKKNLSFEIILNEFQNLIIQSTKNVQDQFERFSTLTAPVLEELRKGNFENAENLLDFAVNQTISNLEDFNKEIQRIYSQLDSSIESDMDKSKLIRKYLEDWKFIREALLQKTQEFYQSTLTEIFVNRIKNIQKVINPIPIKSLSKIFNKSEEEILDRLFSLIQSNKIEGKILENKLYLPEKYPQYNRTINILKKLEFIGNKIILLIRLENTTKDFLYDLDILLSVPDILILKNDESDQKWLHYETFRPEEIKILKWVFQLKSSYESMEEKTNKTEISEISDSEKANTKDKNMGLKYGEVRLFVKYKDIFKEQIELDKRLDIIIH